MTKYECQDCWVTGNGEPLRVGGRPLLASGLFAMQLRRFDDREFAATHAISEEHTVLEIRDGSYV